MVRALWPCVPLSVQPCAVYGPSAVICLSVLCSQVLFLVQCSYCTIMLLQYFVCTDIFDHFFLFLLFCRHIHLRACHLFLMAHTVRSYKCGEEPGGGRQWDLPESTVRVQLGKTLAPARYAKVSSTFGSGCTSLRMLSLSGFKSTHMRTFPDFLGTITIPAHHGVGS